MDSEVIVTSSSSLTSCVAPFPWSDGEQDEAITSTMTTETCQPSPSSPDVISFKVMRDNSDSADTEIGRRSLTHSPSSDHHLKKLMTYACRPTFVSPPKHDDLITAEWTLSRLVAASTRKRLAYEAMKEPQPLDLGLIRIMSVQKLWSIEMEQCRRHLIPAISYVRDLPAFPAMPTSDRCLLFSHCYLPFAKLQLWLTKAEETSPCFTGIKNSDREVYLHNFPMFRQFSEMVDEICQLLRDWQPTTEEVALLLPFLFYQDTLPGLGHPALILNIQQRLKIVLNLHLRHQNSYDLRLRYFMAIYDLLRCANNCYAEATTTLLNSRNDLHIDQLHADMFYISRRPNCSQLLANCLC